MIEGRKITPLFKIRNAESRRKLWKEYSNVWWKTSDSRTAYQRIRRVMEKIVFPSNVICTFEGGGEKKA